MSSKAINLYLAVSFNSLTAQMNWENCASQISCLSLNVSKEQLFQFGISVKVILKNKIHKQMVLWPDIEKKKPPKKTEVPKAQ